MSLTILRTFEIRDVNKGSYLGSYVSRSREQALDTYATSWGYTSFFDMVLVTGVSGIVVTEVE